MEVVTLRGLVVVVVLTCLLADGSPTCHQLKWPPIRTTWSYMKIMTRIPLLGWPSTPFVKQHNSTTVTAVSNVRDADRWLWEWDLYEQNEECYAVVRGKKRFDLFRKVLKRVGQQDVELVQDFGSPTTTCDDRVFTTSYSGCTALSEEHTITYFHPPGEYKDLYWDESVSTFIMSTRQSTFFVKDSYQQLRGDLIKVDPNK